MPPFYDNQYFYSGIFLKPAAHPTDLTTASPSELPQSSSPNILGMNQLADRLTLIMLQSSLNQCIIFTLYRQSSTIIQLFD
jgi:hypothetical protein